jgi:hypothetical protein
LLSNLSFGAFLTYSPHGTTAAERSSQVVCREIKGDGYLMVDEEETPAIAFTVRRLRESLTPGLQELLGPNAVLVPAPGSAPLPPRQQALWVPRRICEELREGGFGNRVEPLLIRHTAVPKSSYAGRGQRPSVEKHYESFSVSPRLGARPSQIVLVDDVITKGATLLAGASRLVEAFPGATVRAFALIRTQNPIDHDRDKHIFRAILDPIVSRITLNQYGPWRRDP